MSNRVPYSVCTVSDSGPIVSAVSGGSGSGVALPANVQSLTHDFNNGSAATTESLAFPSNVGKNNLLVCMVFWQGAVTASVGDNNGNTWNPTAGGNLNLGGSSFAQFFYAPLANAGATTVTLTLSGAGATFIEMTIAEYSGVSTLDQNDQGANGVSTNPVSNAVTPTHATELILGYVGATGRAASWSVAAPFTLRGSAGLIAENLADQVVTSSAPYSVSFTQAVNQTWRCGIATFF